MIVISGAHRTGKSTLAKKLSQEFGWNFCFSRNKELLKTFGVEDWKSFRSMGALQYLEFQVEALSLLMRCFGPGQKISDRGPVDYIAYSIRALNLDKPKDDVFPEVCNLLKRLIPEWSHPIIQVFFRWPGFASDDEGKFIDEIIKDLLLGEASCLSEYGLRERWLTYKRSIKRIVEIDRDIVSSIKPKQIMELIHG